MDWPTLMVGGQLICRKTRQVQWYKTRKDMAECNNHLDYSFSTDHYIQKHILTNFKKEEMK